jgi:hypothetical protein
MLNAVHSVNFWPISGFFCNLQVPLVTSRFLCNLQVTLEPKEPGGCKRDPEVEKGTWRLQLKIPKTKVDAAKKYGYVITSALVLVV